MVNITENKYNDFFFVPANVNLVMRATVSLTFWVWGDLRDLYFWLRSTFREMQNEILLFARLGKLFFFHYSCR